MGGRGSYAERVKATRRDKRIHQKEQKKIKTTEPKTTVSRRGNKITVEYGTQKFTRTTNREYSHIVIGRDSEKDEYTVLGWAGREDLAQQVATRHMHTQRQASLSGRRPIYTRRKYNDVKIVKI